MKRSNIKATTKWNSRPMAEFVTIEWGEWKCLCGNTPEEDGFFPCNAKGELVEPTPKEWTTNCYVCDRCGRIIEQSSRAVVGRRSKV